MKTKVYLGITLRVIALFGIGMLMSYVKTSLHVFLGDVYIGEKDNGLYKDGYDWSGVHYWFFWMCFTIFILSLINCIVSIVKLVKRHYDTSNWGGI